MEQEGAVKNHFKRTLMAIGSALLFLGGKLKWLLAVLKIAKFGTLISMFVSLGFYAWVYGWKFAVALIYLMYVHELGHLLAAKKKGIQTSKAIFIPFLGAMISLKEQPKNAKDEAFLAYGGPFLGTMAFLPAIPLYMITNEPFWGLVIMLGAMINLFNLIPVHPLDGGRIVTVISTKFWIPGILAMSVLMFFDPNPFIALFLLFGITKLWGQIRKEHNFEKLKISNEVIESGYSELERIKGMSEEEQSATLMEWKKELEELKAITFRKWYVPFIEDQKMKEKHRTEQKVDMLMSLIDVFEPEEEIEDDYNEVEDNIEEIEANEEKVESPIEWLQEEFKKDIAENNEKIQAESVYYVSDWKTKLGWFSLYAILAAVLIIATMYGADIMEQHKDLLPK